MINSTFVRIDSKKSARPILFVINYSNLDSIASASLLRVFPSALQGGREKSQEF